MDSTDENELRCDRQAHFSLEEETVEQNRYEYNLSPRVYKPRNVSNAIHVLRKILTFMILIVIIAYLYKYFR